MLHCNVVWNVEINEFFYRTSLTKANRLKDQRVRFGWNATLESSLNYWKERGALFDIFIATEFFTDLDESTIDKLSVWNSFLLYFSWRFLRNLTGIT